MPVLTFGGEFIRERVMKIMPAVMVRHLTYLDAVKIAFIEGSQESDEGSGYDVGVAILLKVASDPVENVDYQRKDGTGTIPGIRLTAEVFKPQVSVEGSGLSPAEYEVYTAALGTLEYQLRKLYDSDKRWPDLFGERV